MKRIILKLFLICTFKAPKLAKNFTNLADFFFLNLTLRSSWSFFPQHSTLKYDTPGECLDSGFGQVLMAVVVMAGYWW